MRYIADSDGYVKEVSFGAVITCGTSECVEYTGTVPEGYTSVEDWFNVCGGELYQRKDDNPETVKDRLVVYHQQTEPLIAYYREKGLLKTVNGLTGVDRVAEDFLKTL